MYENYDGILLIDEIDNTNFIIDEMEALKPIYKAFYDGYVENVDKKPLEVWLKEEMKRQLPNEKEEDLEGMTEEIIATLKVQEEKKYSLEKAISNGRSKESWFASEMKSATSAMSTQESVKYLQGLDDAVNIANLRLSNTIHTKTGLISQNKNLDGFIAEQYHAQTFNLNAEATGSQYRAKVLEPVGQGYAKNSVDVVIVDGSDNIVRRYQAKYCKDAEATMKAFEKGDYRGQQKLVPEEQIAEISKKATIVLEAPDGTQSKALTKTRAKELQQEAQSGQWNDMNWNEYQAKDLAIGIGKNVGQAAAMGAIVGVGFNVAQKVWQGEEIRGEELIETAIVSGSDFGIKAATAHALKVGTEKGIITIFPKGTPAGTMANIAHVGIENVKIIGKVADGELTAKQGLDKMEQTTVATVAGISAGAKGAAIGAAIGTVLGPAGTAIGGFVGGTIGYMAGSKVGETIVKGVQKIREESKAVFKDVDKAIKHTLSDGYSRAKQAVRSFFSW